MSGRPDYDVGDLVVCAPVGDNIDGMPPIGSVWRVTRLAPPESKADIAVDMWAVTIDGYAPPAGYTAFDAGDFRKADPLPDALTSLLASKPVREREPALAIIGALECARVMG